LGGWIGGIDCFMNLHVLIPFHAENCSLNGILILPSVEFCGGQLFWLQRECMCCMGFLQAVMQKVAFAISGTYVSGISYSVNGLAWGRFCIIFVFICDEGILLARNIDCWSRSTLAVHCGWGDSRSLHWGRPCRPDVRAKYAESKPSVPWA
jgi:hypothetical protein